MEIHRERLERSPEVSMDEPRPLFRVVRNAALPIKVLRQNNRDVIKRMVALNQEPHLRLEQRKH
jgi:hypothetical protein